MRRRTAPVALVMLVVLAATTACRDDTVQVAFRPDVGAVYRYEVTVSSTSEVRLPGEAPQSRSEEIVLQSEHAVLAAGRDGVRIQVTLGDARGSVRTFVVRFDRAAQLTSIESDGSVLDEGAGFIGLSEIFPAAAAAPPDGALGPGERWTIDDRVSIPGGAEQARLSGTGRLHALGIEDGHEVARLATSSILRLRSEQQGDDGGIVALDGQQVTEQRADHDLADGAVRRSASTTTGTFNLEIRPPLGQRRDPVHGSLTVRVTSRTIRLG